MKQAIITGGGGDLGAAIATLASQQGYRVGVLDINADLEPGMLVRHPTKPDWEIGQVQSNISGKITVNFPNAGKVVIDGSQIALIPIFDP